MNLKIGEMKKSSQINVQLLFPIIESISTMMLNIKPRNNIERTPVNIDNVVNKRAGIIYRMLRLDLSMMTINGDNTNAMKTFESEIK